MFGSKTKSSSASSTGVSGLGAFAPENETSYSKPVIDFSEPLQVIALASLVVIGLFAYMRFK